MWDIFGIKKRKARRIEKYKEQYRSLSPEAREQHGEFLTKCVIYGTFRNKAVVEMIEAAREVLQEEAQEEEECEAGKSR